MDAAQPQSQAATNHPALTHPSVQGEVETTVSANPGGLVQRAKATPRTLTPAQVLQLQRTLGNQHVQQLLKPKAPPPVSDPATLQRKVYLGAAKVPLDPTTLGMIEKNRGSGARKVSTMAQDDMPNVFFKDKAEMIEYAAGNTEHIGYLEKEKTWIRLPENELLVLGENHGDTTLNDVVKAVGTRKYIYEAYTEVPAELYKKSKRVKDAINDQRGQMAQKAGHSEDSKKNSHDAETFFPKAVIGLAGLRDKIAQAVKDKNKPSQAAAANADDAYTREAAELTMLKQAIIVAAKASKYEVNAEDFWNLHQEILNTTAEEMRGTTALKDTSFIGAIAAGTFTYEGFINSFKEAAQNELVENGEDQEFEDFETQHENLQVSKAPEAQEYERMREFQMLKKIREAKANGYKLAGMGDVHRAHLEKVLDAEGGIQTRKLNTAAGYAPTTHPKFVDEQKARHTP